MKFTRNDQILKLKDHQKAWDLLVIGGGASGLGVALDAVSRGLSVILVEKKDFGSGTSSRSTKLVHGGVRYLAQGNIRLVKEALKERAYILESASHITNILEFIIPFYSIWVGFYYYIGLKFYDFLAGTKSIGKAKWLNSTKVVKKLPNINSHGLKGGISYFDGQFDDARMCIDLVKTIIKNRGTCINYCEVTSFKYSDNLITGAVLHDAIDECEYSISAKAVVNATGVFTNDIIRIEGSEQKRMVVPSRGSHLVLDQSFIGGKTAMMIPKTTDGRILFLIPWKGSLLVGTTDVKTDKIEYEPTIDRAEIDFMLGNAEQYLHVSPNIADIKSIFSGLRPLAAPIHDAKKTKEISRGHKIFWTSSGLCTIIGGKWTTFRKMGEDVIDNIKHKYGWVIPPSRSYNLKIFQSQHTNAVRDFSLDESTIRNIINNEMVETLEDLIARRMRAIFLDVELTLSNLDQWAEILRSEKGRDLEWKDQQIAKSRLLIKNLKRQLIKS